MSQAINGTLKGLVKIENTVNNNNDNALVRMYI